MGAAGGCMDDWSVYNDEKRAKWRIQFETLQLKEKEVAKLFKIFSQIDVDQDGGMGLVELLTLVNVERTAFSERVFSIFDENRSGKIDFREFVLSLWNYCTLSPATLGVIEIIFAV